MVFCCLHVYKDKKSFVGQKSLVSTDKLVNMIIYETAIVGTFVMSLVFFFPISLIVYLNCDHFCQGKTLNQLHSKV
jgi:hypothetical protein